jgi:hypothetical protein
MRHDDLKAGLERLAAEAGRLLEAAKGADEASPLVLAEALIATDRAAKRLAKLRERLAGGANGRAGR